MHSLTNWLRHILSMTFSLHALSDSFPSCKKNKWLHCNEKETLKTHQGRTQVSFVVSDRPVVSFTPSAQVFVFGRVGLELRCGELLSWGRRKRRHSSIKTKTQQFLLSIRMVRCRGSFTTCEHSACYKLRHGLGGLERGFSLILNVSMHAL